MIKRILSATALIASVYGNGISATYTVTNSGTTFSPNAITIMEGDTVIFSLAGSHNAVEVSQSTWNANGSTALPGGFSNPLGGGTVTGLTAGTHYYVCQPHSSFGMKGTITVTPVTGFGESDVSQNTLSPMVMISGNRATITGLRNGFYSTVTGIYDVAGREQNNIALTWSDDRNSVSFDGRSFACGIYIARFTGKNGDTAVKFAVTGK